MAINFPKIFLFHKILSIVLLGCLLLLSTNVFSFYAAFPIDQAPYRHGSASDALNWQGENFEYYPNEQLLACSNTEASITHFAVTSGCLSVRDLASWRRGWIDDDSFRAVAIGRDATGKKIQWTDQMIEYRGYIQNWHSGNLANRSGLHAFARYNDSDNLYLASVRYDGKVTIKRKWQGVYTTLAQTQLNNMGRAYLDENGKLITGQWYRISFSAMGDVLKLYLDGRLVLATKNDTFSQGTIGIRTDKASAYIDDWKLLY